MLLPNQNPKLGKKKKCSKDGSKFNENQCKTVFIARYTIHKFESLFVLVCDAAFWQRERKPIQIYGLIAGRLLANILKLSVSMQRHMPFLGHELEC